MDFHIKTKELIRIQGIIGVNGEDVSFSISKDGLLFSRENDVCYISYPGVFRMAVDRMRVAKLYVQFEFTGDSSNTIYLSRSTKILY